MDLEALGWSDFFARSFHERAEPDSQPGRVTADLGPFFRVLSAAGEHLAEPSGRVRHAALDKAALPVVGDWVALHLPPGSERGQIVAVLERKSRFSRQAAGDTRKEQVVAANVDTVFLVAGLDGDFNLRRLERALLLAFTSGAAPVLVLNKSDLASDVDARRREAEQIAQGVPVVVLSAKARVGLEQLQPFLGAGRSVALLGSSGAGKSTIINRLLGEERQRTQEVRASDSRGRHTTTHRELLLLPTGGVLIDTPGMRAIQLWAGEESLTAAFADLHALAQDCGFRDCVHEHEPRCAVRAAVADGRMPAERLASFHKLRAELRHLELKEDLSLDAAERKRSRTVHKAMRNFRPRR
jgi:ribosome biogenesis GTPase / thiamine phosphate phosphatase